MTTTLYFAYGSNMLHLRLSERCASARPLGHAFAMGWEINFSKSGQDGSGKATLKQSANKEVFAHGVLFEIANTDMPKLDRFEGRGHGYDRDDNFAVTRPDTGELVITKTYIATPQSVDRTLSPFDWYHALVLAGAHQNALPSAHIAWIESVPSIPDLEPHRQQHLDAWRILETSGFGDLARKPAPIR